MLQIAGGILIALFALWLIGKILFWGSLFVRMDEKPDPQVIAEQEHWKAEWKRLEAATTPDATALLRPRMTDEERHGLRARPEYESLKDFSLPSPEPWQLRQPK